MRTALSGARVVPDSVDLPRYSAAVVLGSGPSLTVEDCEAVRAWRRCAVPTRLVVAVNTTYQRASWADVCYAGDLAWFEQYHHDLSRKFSGGVWTGSIAAAVRFPSLRYVRRRSGGGLPQGDSICVGGPQGHSGLQAICLAALRTRRIALLGFDGGPASGKAHWHVDHIAPLKNALRHEHWDESLRTIGLQLEERGIAVTNCSRETRLTAFSRGELGKWLAIS